MKLLTLVLGITLIAGSPLPVLAKGAGNGGCPPGLAKKDPACVPPGLAKKRNAQDDEHHDGDRVRYRDHDDDDHDDRHSDDTRDHHHRVGDHVDEDRYVRLGAGDRVVLDGEEYVVIRAEDGDVLLRRDDDFYRLPRYDDGRYVRIGDELVRMDDDTREIIQIIQLVDLLAN